MQTTLEKIKQIPESKTRFRELASLYADYCAQEGLRVVPFRSPELDVFSLLSEERQNEAIRCLTQYVEVFAELHGEKTSLRDSRTLLWRCLRRLGLTPQSDIFDKIGDDHVVEIYTLDQRQIFHNLKFWEFIGFTIEEVFGSEWWKLTRRPDKISEQLYEFGSKMATGQIDGTAVPDIEEHLVEEIRGASPSRMMLKVLYLSPLRSGGQLAAVMAVNSARIV
jgi:PAS domain-containing protein